MEKVAKVILEVTTWSWIVFVIIAIIMTLNSCASTYTCPSYGGVTEAEVGDMYANQQWDRD